MVSEHLIALLCLISPRCHDVKLDPFHLGSIDTPGEHIDDILRYKSGLQRCGIQPATQNLNMCYQARSGSNMTGLVSPYEYRKRQSMTQAASEDCLFLKWDNTAQPVGMRRSNPYQCIRSVPGIMTEGWATTGGLPVLGWCDDTSTCGRRIDNQRGDASNGWL